MEGNQNQCVKKCKEETSVDVDSDDNSIDYRPEPLEIKHAMYINAGGDTHRTIDPRLHGNNDEGEKRKKKKKKRHRSAVDNNDNNHFQNFESVTRSASTLDDVVDIKPIISEDGTVMVTKNKTKKNKTKKKQNRSKDDNNANNHLDDVMDVKPIISEDGTVIVTKNNTKKNKTKKKKNKKKHIDEISESEQSGMDEFDLDADQLIDTAVNDHTFSAKISSHTSVSTNTVVDGKSVKKETNVHKRKVHGGHKRYPELAGSSGDSAGLDSPRMNKDLDVSDDIELDPILTDEAGWPHVAEGNREDNEITGIYANNSNREQSSCNVTAANIQEDVSTCTIRSLKKKSKRKKQNKKHRKQKTQRERRDGPTDDSQIRTEATGISLFVDETDTAERSNFIQDIDSAEKTDLQEAKEQRDLQKELNQLSSKREDKQYRNPDKKHEQGKRKSGKASDSSNNDNKKHSSATKTHTRKSEKAIDYSNKADKQHKSPDKKHGQEKMKSNKAADSSKKEDEEHDSAADKHEKRKRKRDKAGDSKPGQQHRGEKTVKQLKQSNELEDKAALQLDLNLSDVKVGKWSGIEDQQMKKNMAQFCKNHDVDDPRKMLFSKEYADGVEYKRLARKYNLFIELGHGIDRDSRCIYFRARKLFDTQNYQGVFTEDEIKELKRLHAIHGNDWITIGKAMGRSSRSVNSRFRIMKKNQVKGPWSKEEKDQLLKAVEKVMGSSTKQNDVFYNIPWSKIAEHVPTRNDHQCRRQWLFYSSSKKGQHEVQAWSRPDAANLVEIIYSMKITDESDIDWIEMLNNYFPKISSPQKLSEKWTSLKQRHVDRYRFKTFEVIVNDLYHNYAMPLLGKSNDNIQDED